MTWDSEKNIFHTVEFTAVKCTVIMIVVDYEVNGVIAEQRFQKRCISLCDLDVNVREFFLKICDDRWQNITGVLAPSDRLPVFSVVRLLM